MSSTPVELNQWDSNFFAGKKAVWFFDQFFYDKNGKRNKWEYFNKKTQLTLIECTLFIVEKSPGIFCIDKIVLFSHQDYNSIAKYNSKQAQFLMHL